MKLKRIIAYLLDMIIITFISSFIFGFIITNNDIERYNELTKESTELLFNSGSSDPSEEELLDMEYELQTMAKPIYIIRIGLYILYFGVLAFLLKGKTIGKKIFNLQVVSVKTEDLNPGLFMLRTVILTNFIPEAINLITLILCPKSTWFQISTITSYISTAVIFLMIGFVIFRDDERGLHDIICGTKVISTKESQVSE